MPRVGCPSADRETTPLHQPLWKRPNATTAKTAKASRWDTTRNSNKGCVKFAEPRDVGKDDTHSPKQIPALLDAHCLRTEPSHPVPVRLTVISQSTSHEGSLPFLPGLRSSTRAPLLGDTLGPASTPSFLITGVRRLVCLLPARFTYLQSRSKLPLR
jgi:hypothetical protein